jgi:hypothetical protein
MCKRVGTKNWIFVYPSLFGTTAMSRHIRILIAREVETKSEPGYHADGDGPYLQVTAKGAKSWIYRFSLNKKRRDMGLGSYPGVALAKAREKCAEARALERRSPLIASRGTFSLKSAPQPFRITLPKIPLLLRDGNS